MVVYRRYINIAHLGSVASGLLGHGSIKAIYQYRGSISFLVLVLGGLGRVAGSISTGVTNQDISPTSRIHRLLVKVGEFYQEDGHLAALYKTDMVTDTDDVKEISDWCRSLSSLNDSYLNREPNDFCLDHESNRIAFSLLLELLMN